MHPAPPEVELAASGVQRLVVPLPFRPRSVNAYLVALDGGGWMLVDGGIDSSEAWSLLADAVAAIGGWRALRMHVVTHMHIDHIGLAPRVRDASSVPLAMGELDAERAARAAADPAREELERARLFRRHGVPEPVIDSIHSTLRELQSSAAFVTPDLHLPSVTLRLPHASEWTSVWTPGHTAGHIALYRSRDRLLLAGDAVIPRVSPTIGVNSQRRDSVGDYLGTLDRLEGLRPEIVLGGHGQPLRGVDRIRELRNEVLDESARVRECLAIGPGTAWEATRRRYTDRELPPPMQMQALRETLAHLRRLVSAGFARSTELEGVVHFSAAAAAAS